MDRMHTERLLTLAAAAEALQTTPLHVLMHVKRGILSGTETADGWLLDAGKVAELIQERRRGETTAVCKSSCPQAGGCASCA